MCFIKGQICDFLSFCVCVLAKIYTFSNKWRILKNLTQYILSNFERNLACVGIYMSGYADVSCICVRCKIEVKFVNACVFVINIHILANLLSLPINKKINNDVFCKVAFFAKTYHIHSKIFNFQFWSCTCRTIKQCWYNLSVSFFFNKMKWSSMISILNMCHSWTIDLK